MRMKILGAVALATGLVLAGCSGSSGSTSSSGGSTSTSGTTGNNTTGTTSTTGSTGTTSSTTTSSSTSGTTSSTTTSSTTSSGSTGGSTGNSDASCGTNHVACGTDSHCYNYNPSGQAIYACGCEITSLADGGSNDTCANNPDGKDICDTATFNCRLARDYDVPGIIDYGDGGGDYICDTGYDFVNFGTSLAPDIRCLGTCNSTADCKSNFVYCLQGALSTVDGGGQGACVENDCGPDLMNYPTWDDGGVQTYDDGGHVLWDDGGVQTVPAPAGDYYGACDINGARGDGGSGGTCLPLGQTDSYIGICFRDGTGVVGAPCTGFVGPMTGDTFGATTLTACASGALCIPDLGIDIPAGTSIGGTAYFAAHCDAVCNADTDGGGIQLACPTVSGTQQTCYQLNGDPVGNPLQAGVCL